MPLEHTRQFASDAAQDQTHAKAVPASVANIPTVCVFMLPFIVCCIFHNSMHIILHRHAYVACTIGA